MCGRDGGGEGKVVVVVVVRESSEVDTVIERG